MTLSRFDQKMVQAQVKITQNDGLTLGGPVSYLYLEGPFWGEFHPKIKVGKDNFRQNIKRQTIMLKIVKKHFDLNKLPFVKTLTLL